MTFHTLRRLAVPLVASAALAVPATASADPAPTQVTVSQNATFVSPWQVNLEVTIVCTPGWWYSVNAQVLQPQGFLQAAGSGWTSGPCTGRHQKLALPVYAYSYQWQLGEAVASVSGCAGPCDTAARSIRIGL